MSFVDEMQDGMSVTRWSVLRPPHENPQDPRCDLHLRLVCGVCPHFAGRLRQAGPGPCGRLGGVTEPDRDATTCRFWARRDREVRA